MALVTLTKAATTGRGTPKASVANRSRIFDPTKAIWATRVQRYNPATGLPEDALYATRNKFTAWSAQSEAAGFSIRLIDPATADRQAFGAHRTSGRGDITLGNVELNNAFGALDVYRGYPIDGRAVTSYIGMDNDDFPSGFTIVHDGTAQSEIVGQDFNVIQLRDWQRAAQVPLQTTLYTGANVLPAGLEGTTELTGKAKPITLGQCRNVPGTMVNTSKLIEQFHDGPASITTVYDEGLPLAAGLVWTAGTSPAFGDLNGVAVSDTGTICVLGAGGTIKYSTNRGSTWSTGLSATGTDFLKIAWGSGDGFMAVGKSPGPGTFPGQLYTSPDGITWTNRSSAHSLGNVDITGVAFGMTAAGNVWVICGGLNAEYSTNFGVSWTGCSPSFGGANVNSVAFGGGKFLFVGNSGNTGIGFVTSGSFTYSTYGTTILCAAYGGGTWVIGLVSGGLASSIDGTGWTMRTTNTTNDIQSVCFGAGKFIFCTSVGEASLSLDGATWQFITIGVGSTPDDRNITYGTSLGQFVIVGASNYIALSAAPGLTYANVTDLQDDTLAPAPGTYKVYSGSEGCYVRLGSPPAGKVTADVVQGAAASNRTAGQLFALVLQRAGFVAVTDYSTSDITALDTANNAVCGYFTDAGDSVMCADAADQLLASVGAGWWADQNGIVRTQRLTSADGNLVASPNALATSPWQNAGGTVFATNGVGVYAGKSFSRISNATTGPWIQPITITTTAVHYLTVYIKSNGVAGSGSILLKDAGSVSHIDLTFVVASDGSITASAGTGTLKRIALLPAPVSGVSEQVYGITVKSTSCTAGAFNLYASNASTLASFLIAGVVLSAGDPAATLSSINGTTGEIENIVMVASADPNGGLPCTRTTIRASKNFDVFTGSDVADSVSDASRATLFADFLDSSTSVDASVQAAHPLSVERIDQTLLANTTDAATEATRKQALFGTDRFWFDVTCLLTQTTAAVDLGNVVELVTDRYLMGAGVRARVLGIHPDAAAGRVTFACWL